MSELKTYFLGKNNGREFPVYLKSEADKVIKELEETLKNSRNAREYWRKEYLIEYKECCHHKYKRCLAMAEWCESTSLWCYQAANTLMAGFHATLYGKPVMIEPDRLFKRHLLLIKWHKRWLELAEKFKEAK